MNTHLIKETYLEICKLPLPFEGGKEINGIHLTLLDADIAGFALRVEQAADFNRQDKVVLQQCLKELEAVFPYLTEAEVVYFSRHRLVCNELLKGFFTL